MNKKIDMQDLTKEAATISSQIPDPHSIGENKFQRFSANLNNCGKWLRRFFESENCPDDDAWMLQCSQAMALTAIAQELHELNKREEAPRS